jgi:hypothetical protein
LGLGDPWVTHASPKGDPSATQGKILESVFVFNKS